MIKTPELEQLCKELAKPVLPNWKQLVKKFKSHPDFDPNNRYTLHGLRKYFSEMHIGFLLEKLLKNHVEWNVDLDPIRNVNPRGYRILYTYTGNVQIFNENPKPGKKRSWEFDHIILLNNLPVVVEVRLSTYKRGSTGAKNIKPHSDVFHSLLPENYDSKLEPIKDLFQRDVGYVLVICREVYDNRMKNSKTKTYQRSAFASFQKNNGIFVPFYKDRKSFRTEAKNIAEKNGLQIV